MRDGFACHLAHVQNLAAAGSGKERRGGDQAKLPVILSVIEKFAAVDILASSEMAMRVMLLLSRANSVHRPREWHPRMPLHTRTLLRAAGGLFALLGFEFNELDQYRLILLKKYSPTRAKFSSVSYTGHCRFD